MNDKKKVIYCYKKKDDVSGTFKIGKADQRADHPNATIEEIAERRINEQQTAATHGALELVHVWDISSSEDSTAVEHSIHNAIVNNGWERLVRENLGGKVGTTEWFSFGDVDEYEVINFVSKTIEKVTGDVKLNSYKGRGYQEYVKSEVLKAVNNGSEVIGCELAARFGKTLWSLDLFKTLTEENGYQYMLLPAYVLTAHSSFGKEIASFEDFKDIVFVNDKDENFEDVVRNNSDKKLVIGISLHTPENSQSKYDVIAELDKSKKVSFIDEADFGAHTESSRQIADRLDPALIILMTGTAIERAIASYDVDSIVKWSYFDMLCLKDGSHPILDTFFDDSNRQAAIDSCASLVKPKMFKISLPQAQAIQESMPDVLQTKWSKLLTDVEKNSAILERIVRAMFRAEHGGIPEMATISLSNVTPANVTMIFGGFPNKGQQGKFCNLLKGWLGDDYIVVKVNGDETSNRKAEEDTKRTVKKAQRNGKKVVIVSKDMASRSYSIPEIDTVFLMYDKGLLSQTVQKVSRVFTPGSTYNNESKKEGVVVSLSLDGNRQEIDPIDLYIVAEAERIAEEGESLQQSIKRVCLSANIFENDIDSYDVLDLDVDEYAERLLSRSSVIKDIFAGLNFDDNALDDIIITDDRRSNPNVSIEENVTVDTSKVVTTRPEDKEEEEKDKEVTEDDRKQIIENILYFAQNIGFLKSLASINVTSVREALKDVNDGGESDVAEFEEEYGMSCDTVVTVLDRKILPERLLNTAFTAANDLADFE